MTRRDPDPAPEPESGEDLDVSAPDAGWSFADWFEGQHGPRPSPLPEYELEQQADSLERAAKRASDLAAAVARWEERRTTALYAWQILDKEKRDV